jgi:hypothetical protein
MPTTHEAEEGSEHQAAYDEGPSSPPGVLKFPPVSTSKTAPGEAPSNQRHVDAMLDRVSCAGRRAREATFAQTARFPRR